MVHQMTGRQVVIASRSRSKNGVASLAYGEAIQPRVGRRAAKSKSCIRSRLGVHFSGALARASWIASSLRSSQ
jgi:hypothetical protein